MRVLLTRLTLDAREKAKLGALMTYPRNDRCLSFSAAASVLYAGGEDGQIRLVPRGGRFLVDA